MPPLSRSTFGSIQGRGSQKKADGSYALPNPTLDVLWRLANALQVDVMYLVNHEREVEPNPVRTGD